MQLRSELESTAEEKTLANHRRDSTPSLKADGVSVSAVSGDVHALHDAVRSASSTDDVPVHLSNEPTRRRW